MPNDLPERVRFGPYEADLRTHELWKHGIRLKLVGQPFEILAMLLARPGELVTREELRARLWPGDTFVDFNHGLNAAVNKLRDALSDSAEEPRYIETLPRRGYRFIAAVEQPVGTGGERVALSRPTVGGEIGAQSEPALSAIPEAQVVSPAPTADMSRRPRWRGLGALLLALLAALSISLLWFVFHRSDSGTPSRANVPLRPTNPLTNLPDPTTDPAFSPDGNRVAFRREGYEPGTSGLFVKQIGSLQLLQLTSNPADCCPVWSPDGGSIAFSRFTDKAHQIYTVSSEGGALRKLYSSNLGLRRGDLDWSRDGESIAFVGQSPQGTSAVFLLSLKDLTAHRITEPPLLNNDRGPAFSPDGEQVAFIRTRETSLPENIVVMPAGGGEVRVLSEWYNGILGPPAWAADGKSILFAAGDGPDVWRVPASGGEESAVGGLGPSAWHPAVSRKGNRLAFGKNSKAVSIWQMDLNRPREPHLHSVVVTDTGRNEGAQISPDGKHLVFMSSRGGGLDIWISDRDGSHPRQLTNMSRTGTPHWSPDGRFISFDSGEDKAFVVEARGGTPRPIVNDNSQSLVPNWSRDGKWIYFASARSGTHQVWKVPSSGGSAVQVTAHGGFAAYESSNGKILYYSKTNMPNPEVWRIPVDGGAEIRVSPLLRPETWANWALADRGIYFVKSM